MITISDILLTRISEHGEAEYPNECCGIILGTIEQDKSKKAADLIPISNARAENEKFNRFLITPEELMRSELAARRRGLDIIGFYHSHPDHPSEPSEYDREYAWPFYSYIIVSIKKGVREIITSWELQNDRTSFTGESLIKGD